jgi:6-phosphogluconolactonase
MTVARSFMAAGLFGVLMFAFGNLAIADESPAAAKKYWVYIGTYTGEKPEDSRGIYRAEFDSSTGKLGEPALAGEIKSPSFLAIHPNGRFLYAVGETADFGGVKSGSVNAFAIDTKSGDLELLNRQSSGGGGPCHIVVDRTGKHALVANYGGGSCESLPIRNNGELGEPTSVIQHRGSSVNPQRQEAPHTHSINLDAANRFAVCADLGLDKVLVYKFDADSGTLSPNEPPSYDGEPGAGPRHFAFHPSGRFAYVNNEITSSVTALQYNADRGVLTKIHTLSTLPAPHRGNSTAETVVHPSGKFLYVSNRGHNSIAVFRIDGETGRLTAAGHQGEGISVPRNFNVDPSGKWLLVANQQGHNINVFSIDQETGELTTTGTKVAVPTPVCIRFLARAGN